MYSLLRPLSRLFRVGKSRHLAGTDLQGNRFYEYPSLHGSDDPRHTRRLIEYRVKQDHYCLYDTKNVAVQWNMWLRHTRMDAPSLQELEADRQRIVRLQENVRLIAIRDEESRRAAEVRRLEAHGEAVSSHQQPQQASPPNLRQAPEQSQVQVEASARAASSARQTRDALRPAPSSPETAPAPSPPRPRARTPTRAIPTSQVQEEGVPQLQRSKRVPISTSRPKNLTGTETSGGNHLPGRTIEVREADNDVWKASRERIQRQDRGMQVESSGGRRSYSTMAGKPRAKLGMTSEVLTAMQPGLVASQASRRSGLRFLSTGPVRPPRYSPRPRPTPSPRPVPPLPPSPPSASRATPGASPTKPDVPIFVYIAGGAIIMMGLAIALILPDGLVHLSSEKVNSSARSPTPVDSSIRADRWITLPILQSIYAVSPSHLDDVGDGHHKLMTLGISPSGTGGKIDAKDGRRPLSISSLSIAQPDIQIERSYTPLQSPLQSEAEGKVELLIKRYAHGEMGRYLHGLSVGEGVEVRGWLKSWDETWMKSLASAKSGLDEVVLIVGGTGITSAYQLISSALEASAASSITAAAGHASPQSSTTLTSPSLSNTDRPIISLLYASARPSSFLLLPDLLALQTASEGRLNIVLFSEEGVGKHNLYTEVKGWLGQRAQGKIGGFPALKGRIQLTDLEDVLRSRSTSSSSGMLDPSHTGAEGKRGGRAILVVGPEGMVENVAGAREVSRDGRVMQGRLGGLLKEVGGVDEGEVWKL